MLIASWPHLEHLTLSPVEQPISLSILIKIMQLLPRAHTIIVPATIMREEDLAAWEASTDAFPTFKQVERLHLNFPYCSSWGISDDPKDEDTVASLLFLLAPRLFEIDPAGGGDGLFWEHVVNVLREKQTRARAHPVAELS